MPIFIDACFLWVPIIISDCESIEISAVQSHHKVVICNILQCGSSNCLFSLSACNGDHCVVKATMVYIFGNSYHIKLSQCYLPAVKVLTYTGLVESPLNPVWLTVKL